jgi:hypothetical protein
MFNLIVRLCIKRKLDETSLDVDFKNGKFTFGKPLCQTDKTVLIPDVYNQKAYLYRVLFDKEISF